MDYDKPTEKSSMLESSSPGSMDPQRSVIECDLDPPRHASLGVDPAPCVGGPGFFIGEGWVAQKGESVLVHGGHYACIRRVGERWRLVCGDLQKVWVDQDHLEVLRVPRVIQMFAEWSRAVEFAASLVLGDD